MRKNVTKNAPETQTVSWVDGLSDRNHSTSDIGGSIKMANQGSGDAWREDARLHRRFMDLEEENNEQLQGMQTRLKHSERECHNLQLLIKQLHNKKRLLEMQLRLRDEQISSFFNKQQPASIKCKKSTKDFQPQQMTIDSLLPPSSSSLPSSSSAPLLVSSHPSTSSSSSSQPHMNLLKTANETIDRLEKETEELKKDKKENQNIINKLNKKLKRMDNELEKLCVEKMHKDSTDTDIDLLLKMQDEKNGMMKMVEEMRNHEKELLRELQELRQQVQKNVINDKKHVRQPVVDRFRANEVKSKNIKKNNKGNNKESGGLDVLLKAVENERDQCKQEVTTLNNLIDELKAERTNKQKDKEKYQEMVDRLSEEVKECKRVKQEMNKKINLLQSNIITLTEERDHLSMLHKKTKSELDSRRRLDMEALKEASKEKCRCDEWKIKLEKAQSAITELTDTVTYEREKHKKSSQQLMNALHKSERCNDRNNIFIQRLQNTIKQINNNNNINNKNNDSMNYLTNNYNNKNNRNNNNNDDDEEMMDGYLKQLRNVLEESSHYQRLANQMKDLLEEKMKEIQKAEEDRKQLSILRSKLSKSEAGKQELYELLEGQKRAEEALQGTVDKQEALINDMKKSLDESEKVINQQRAKLTSRETEVMSLKDQLNVKAIVEGSKMELESEKQRLLREVERMTAQIQQLQQSLSSQQSSCSQLTASNNDLLYEIQRCQRVITSKDQQLSNTEERLKNAQQEIDRLQSISCHMHTEMGCKQEELASREEELKALKARWEELQDELKKLKDSEIELKERVGLLLRRVGWMDGEMVKMSEGKRVAEEKMKEWMSVGEMVRKESAQIQEELVCKTVEVHKLKNELEEQKNNLELGHQSESRSLRTEIAKVATKNNVLQKEVDMLNKTIEDQRKQQHTQTEKVTQLEGQIAKANRKLISEQFEKERMIQELKRNNIPLPNQTSLGAISPNSLARTIYQREESKLSEVMT